MIQNMYKKREKFAYMGILFVTIVCALYVLFDPPSNNKQWLESSPLLLPIVFLLVIALRSRHHYKQVKDLSVPNFSRSITETNHLVIKKDTGIIPQLLCFEKSGAFIGVFKPTGIPFWLYPILFYKESLLQLFPVTFSFVTHDGITLFTCKRQGIKKSVLTIHNFKETVLGTYVQEEFKSLIHIKGSLLNEKNEPLLAIKTSGFSGDFTLKDDTGEVWAHFYNGRFPHKYTKLFRDLDNDIVEVSPNLSEHNKLLLLGTVAYLFMQKTTRG
ncbi:hypothetical protein [Radiobacillus deserti]|uniref:Uncharacterized protein n=1 Tax=Radiobacillus deserti TaxID=2594883 RepID=A0A516KJP8_9BACI|nr:hypothetical protein [Radiobacillus deserti]QDP41612.1 hypothetical protein FN924_16405 [Radiobacillus deserti]